jgi:hypothetical protein
MRLISEFADGNAVFIWNYSLFDRLLLCLLFFHPYKAEIFQSQTNLRNSRLLLLFR